MSTLTFSVPLCDHNDVTRTYGLTSRSVAITIEGIAGEFWGGAQGQLEIRDAIGDPGGQLAHGKPDSTSVLPTLKICFG
jgi:hypothetical protein